MVRFAMSQQGSCTSRLAQADGLAPLGQRLRAVRQERGLTLKDVASAAGFSVGFISQVERGITVPSLTSLLSIGQALGIDTNDFFSNFRLEKDAGEERHERSLDPSTHTAVRYERLSVPFQGNILRSVIIHKPPGFRDAPVSHEGEEIFFVLAGEITLEVAGHRAILRAGDSAHFQSTHKHSVWNHTMQPASVLHTCTMDVFAEDGHVTPVTDVVAITRSRKRSDA